MKHSAPAFMKTIREFKEVLSLTQHSPKSKNQLNHLFESDCEIVGMKVSKVGQQYFCASTDSLGEEMTLGLYKDPYLWGWLTVMSSVSDLSVTGAQPLGLLLSTQWKFKTSDALKKAYYRGANAALKKVGIGLLGGDSGYSADHVMTSSIFGVSHRPPLTRMGAEPGDYVVMLEAKKLGVGPCLAYRYLLKLAEAEFPETLFRPTPQLELIQKLQPLVKASIDTSDGLAACLHIIARLNHIGFTLEWEPKLLHPKALAFCKNHHLHPLLLWMSDLGDLQGLLFISPKNIKKAKQLAPNLLILGQCTNRPHEYTVNYNGQTLVLPFKQVSECARDAKAYEDLALGLNDYFQTQDLSRGHSARTQ